MKRITTQKSHTPPVRTIIDFEASALYDGYPIEIGIAHTWSDGNITSVSNLIKHDPWLFGGNWSPDAERLHKITVKEIMETGMPVKAVARWLKENIHMPVAYADSELDKGWLKQLFDAAGERPEFELRQVHEIFETAKSIDDHCIIKERRVRHHRAAPDAEQISRILTNCLELPAPRMRA